MLDKDKLWVAFYVNVGNIDEVDVPNYMNEFVDNFTFDESVKPFYIPTKGDDKTRIEVIKPSNDRLPIE